MVSLMLSGLNLLLLTANIITTLSNVIPELNISILNALVSFIFLYCDIFANCNRLFRLSKKINNFNATNSTKVS